MSIAENLQAIQSEIPDHVTLVAVSKTHPASVVQEAYEAGQRHFGENKVQEMVDKAQVMPDDIHWHLIGHLQRNKVKYIAPFVHLVHSVDSLKLLKEIEKRAAQQDRVINCLLQVHIADEETKFGFAPGELNEVLSSGELDEMKHICIKGLMGMATFTNDQEQVKREFAGLKQTFDQLKADFAANDRWQPEVLSMGMSGDYAMAIEQGSTMVRVGSAIFGARNYG